MCYRMLSVARWYFPKNKGCSSLNIIFSLNQVIKIKNNMGANHNQTWRLLSWQVHRILHIMACKGMGFIRHLCCTSSRRSVQFHFVHTIGNKSIRVSIYSPPNHFLHNSTPPSSVIICSIIRRVLQYTS